jgi:RNA polymerase sigma-32 factor
MSEVNRFQILTKDEEKRLARRWRNEEDVEAAGRLVTANLRFVVKVAHEYKGYGLRLLDIIQEGNIGLMHAVKRFDPDRGTRFISYGVFWIRAYIHKYVMSSWNIVKLNATRANRKLFYRLGQIRGLLGKSSEERDQERKKMAAELEISEADIMHVERLVATEEVRLDQPTEDGRLRAELIAYDAPNQEQEVAEKQSQQLLKTRMSQALNKLNERERTIIEARYLDDDTTSLRAVGDRLGISGERVRQLEQRAMSKMKKSLGTDLPAEVFSEP